MNSRITKSLMLEGNELVTSDGVEVCRLPAGLDPLSRLPHVARAMLDPELRAAFELAMALGFGCAGIIVREHDRNIETPVWSDDGRGPIGGADDC